MFPEILAHGGTITLHDIALGAGFYVLARQLGQYGEFEDRMLSVEGQEAVRDLGVALGRLGGTLDLPALKDVFNRHPLLRWVTRDGNTVFTHTNSLASDLLNRYPDASVRVVRQGYSDQLPRVRHLPMQLWRHRLGIGSTGILVGIFGIIGRNKRVDQSIAAFDRLWQKHPDSLLVIAGSCYDDSYQQALVDMIRLSRAGARIVMVDYVPPDIFHTLIALSDVVVNLRWPALGGVSAVLLRSLAAGKPVIISDIPDWRALVVARRRSLPTCSA
jgi:glycosyltransferase involved in cell wall biosynthesis